jgi:hypothetical protein
MTGRPRLFVVIALFATGSLPPPKLDSPSLRLLVALLLALFKALEASLLALSIARLVLFSANWAFRAAAFANFSHWALARFSNLSSLANCF